MKSVEVAVRPPYRVLVGAGLLRDIGDIVAESSVALITDSHVGPLYLERLREGLCAGERRQLLPIEIPAGEGSKSLETLSDVLRRMAQAGLRRDCAVVALGGGMVSDLAGFAAASYLRGVSFYTCPTTLLAMVDASVGGKTGVNLPEGKNLVGAFWQPRAVVADVTTLASLTEHEFRSGAVELFKHGLLSEPYLLQALDDPQFAPTGAAEALEEYVARSVSVKAEVVADDEREAGGRAYLNLGHSLAHALEAASEHGISHGDAVAYGLLFAALLGAGRGWFDFGDEALRLLTWLDPAPLPCREYDELVPFMLRDKKNSGTKQRFVLLREAGLPVLVDDVGEAEQRRAWGQMLEALS